MTASPEGRRGRQSPSRLTPIRRSRRPRNTTTPATLPHILAHQPHMVLVRRQQRRSYIRGQGRARAAAHGFRPQFSGRYDQPKGAGLVARQGHKPPLVGSAAGRAGRACRAGCHRSERRSRIGEIVWARQCHRLRGQPQSGEHPRRAARCAGDSAPSDAGRSTLGWRRSRRL